ncbi:unnamed protein product [Parnassius apollo]|uniref:(apollo) hypothetical protein n=1 Tax=Parnassius apollo TaxID=110799 RepID=A0A8S3W6L5_PARAO|nr:unnamed protein product [Parnassius apollo]
MSKICFKCREEIRKRDFIECFNCKKLFHLDCTSIGEKFFFLLDVEKRNKCLCDLCKYHILPNLVQQNINIPTTNSFDALDVDDEYTEFVTFRQKNKKLSESLPDLSDSFIITHSHSLNLQKISRSLPDDDLRDCLIIQELKEEVSRLRTELIITNKEVDNLNITKRKLTKKILEEEEIIKLYKSVSIDDVKLRKTANNSYNSTPLTKPNKQNRKSLKSDKRHSFEYVERIKLKETLPATQPEKYVNDYVETITSKIKTSEETCEYPPKRKLCVISNIRSNKMATTMRNHFETQNICHYRITGGGIVKLLRGVQTKLVNYTLNDFCILIVGETDFDVSKNYNDLVMNIRKTLLTVQHTNILPTFKFCYHSNIYNRRIETFNNLLYSDNINFEYCYILDSNKNLDYSTHMFSGYNGKLNKRGLKTILHDINKFIRTFDDVTLSENRRIEDISDLKVITFQENKIDTEKSSLSPQNAIKLCVKTFNVFLTKLTT